MHSFTQHMFQTVPNLLLSRCTMSSMCMVPICSGHLQTDDNYLRDVSHINTGCPLLQDQLSCSLPTVSLTRQADHTALTRPQICHNISEFYQSCLQVWGTVIFSQGGICHADLFSYGYHTVSRFPCFYSLQSWIAFLTICSLIKRVSGCRF